jgi:hypothetical protein
VTSTSSTWTAARSSPSPEVGAAADQRDDRRSPADGKEDYDAFLLHQANTFMINHIAKKAKLPKEKVPINMDRYGNTSSATIPLLMTTDLADRTAVLLARCRPQRGAAGADAPRHVRLRRRLQLGFGKVLFHPLGFGKPDDIANAAVYLLSDAGRWVTGTSMVVDGGAAAK